MSIQFLHRMHGPESYPHAAAERAPAVLATWLHYSPDSIPADRDFEDWAENAIMLHFAHQRYGHVELLPNPKGILVSGDRTSFVPPQPGKPRAFMYGMWKPSDSLDFLSTYNMAGNDADSVRTVAAYPLSPVFRSAAGREFHVVDADRQQIETVLQHMHSAGHRRVFIKTRFKGVAGTFDMPDQALDLWDTISRDTPLEWLLVQHEGAAGVLFIQEAFEPRKEYRTIIVRDRVVTGAGCIESFTPLGNRGTKFDNRMEDIRNQSQPAPEPDLLERYIEFAETFARRWADEHGDQMIYSLDLAVDARTGNILPIEMNPMTNLGLYASNANSLVAAIANGFSE